ncbi:unnamed protein product [Litomosoides sigmodontis]|uniref:Protein-tyrosine-phosphatase n=1 Tax=Litomosoides sigmodontis TaxID=42156 RepID=A0A3P6U0D8_LITSI|nr:unnamed protein product [Litomosoides sigmodontis]
MDRIRCSFRESLRRRMSKQHFHRRTSGRQSSPSKSVNNSGSSKAELWQPDEIAVRNGTCSFSVKYLGGIEVFESRGMQICEGALKLLRGQRRRPIKAILYVSGDGLRVVDQESSRGLIVDQTIEKVSFCAPDRSHDKSFAYICRDGTSRRWMCHGFHAMKETGERLSHAVGCAFAICLERKKRDAEASAAAVQAAISLSPLDCKKRSTSGFILDEITKQTTPTSNSSFERSSSNGSFRRLSITERLRDPQNAIVQPPPATSSLSSTLHITSKPRPVGNPLLFVRQRSLRAPTSYISNTALFHRQLSLRSYPIKQQQMPATVIARSEPIFEDDEDRMWPNEGSTFGNAPYCPVKYNGFRQSLSYTAAPYANNNNTCDFSSTKACTLVNSPLQIQTNYSSSISGRESWLSSPISTCPSTAKSKADEWLEQTLRSSLSLNSPNKNAGDISRFCQQDKPSDISRTSQTTNGVPPPDHPPPPLPSPSTIRDTGSETTAIRFSSDFSQYELSTTAEKFSSLSENTTATSSKAVESDIDIFGQPVFSAVLSYSKKSAKDNNATNECVNKSESEKPDQTDPFDVRWSHLAVDVATTYPMPVHSTNPFYSESSAYTLKNITLLSLKIFASLVHVIPPPVLLCGGSFAGYKRFVETTIQIEYSKRQMGKKRSIRRRSVRSARKELADEDGTQMERDSRPGRRRFAALRKGPQNQDTIIQMKNFCTTTVATGVQGLMKEFNEIRASSIPPSQLVKTAFDKNPDKNRYKDVFCVDETRVVLNYPPETNDYIHANWVNVVSTKKRFICTQAPKENTVEDFWRMIWQESCRSIVMLCNIMECGKKKCEQYWPAEEGESKEYGTLKVTCNRVIQEEKMLTISNLVITNGSKKLILEHIAWNDWPDRGVPNNFLAPFRLLQRIKNQIHVVIHCSAGIGRTGTVVGLDIADSMFNDGMKVTMRDVIRELRLQRHGSVQTDIQYVYIHRCILALSENRKLIKRDEIASFLNDFEILAHARGGLPSTPAK